MPASYQGGLVPRDLQCAPRPSRIHRYQPSTSKQKCHPDRSEAKWRDLLFLIRTIESAWKRHPPLCHPERSRGICGAPLDPPEFPVSNLPLHARSGTKGAATLPRKVVAREEMGRSGRDDKRERLGTRKLGWPQEMGHPQCSSVGGLPYEANNWVRLLRRSSSFTRADKLTSSSLQYPSRRADTLSPTRVPRPELSI